MTNKKYKSFTVRKYLKLKDTFLLMSRQELVQIRKCRKKNRELVQAATSHQSYHIIDNMINKITHSTQYIINAYPDINRL